MIKDILRHLAPLGALALLAGCASPAQQQAETDREQKAMFAVAAQYPIAEPMDGLGASAAYNARTGVIRVANPTDELLTDVMIWLDGAYVHHIPAIAPHSSVVVRLEDFFDMRGRTAAERQTPVERMEIQRDDELFRVPMAGEE